MKHKILSLVALLFFLMAFAISAYSYLHYRTWEADILSYWKQLNEEKEEKIAELTLQLDSKQSELEEYQEELGNTKLELKSLNLPSSNPSLYEQCFLEMTWQTWGVNTLYCKELELPVFRAVADSNWNLIQDASINNFTMQNLDAISLSLCSSYIEINSFSYLLTDNAAIAGSQTPPVSGWIEALPDENGDYWISLQKLDDTSCYRYLLIKYSINTDVYYGLLTTGMEFE